MLAAGCSGDARRPVAAPVTSPAAPAVATPAASRSATPKPTPAPATKSARPKPKPKPKPPVTVVRPEDRWALVVGVGEYAGRVSDTYGGRGDAVAVRRALLAAGWRKDHIRVLTDEQATGRALRRELEWLVSRSSDRTFTFFHFSGHVKQTGGREYLWPTDSALVSDRDVARTLKRLKGRAWLDFAGCEAGGFDERLASRDRLVTGSSQVTEKSYEYPDWDQSVWTGLMFGKGLDRRRADRDDDGDVTVAESIAYARKRATEITIGQQPYGPQRPYVEGGGRLDWTLAAPPLTAAGRREVNRPRG